MKLIAVATAIIATANSLATGNETCCFTLTASGGQSGPVGQIDDGQTRIGNGTQPGQFCVNSSGAIVDGKGRGCFLTPPTSQLQCDEGASPQPGFSVDSSGRLHHNGSTEFIACLSSQGDQLNIYTNPAPQDVNGCQNVSFEANNCHSTGPSASAPGAIPTSPTNTAAPPPGPGPTSPGAPSGPGSGPGPGPHPGPGPSAPGSPGGPNPGPEPGPGGGPHPGPPGGPSPPSNSSIPAPLSNSYPPEGSHPAGSSAPGGPSGTGTPAPGALGAPPPNKPEPPTASEPGPSHPSGTSHPESPGGPGTSPTGPGTPPSNPSGAGCPTDLTPGNYEFPHLIIPIDSSSPSKIPGTSFNGTIDSKISSIFNFDIPPSLSGKRCSLVFLFPTKDKLITSSYSFSGDGAIDFAQLQSPATLQTSASNAPAVRTNLGVTTVSPGHSYTITTFSCPAGETIAYEMKNAGTTDLEWFEDFNPAA
ncbi:uncharacterized protein TRUGW13939_00739 [Talaromyces rugulosus]|uniref:Ig-like domain-containing protein n=1 Tax=Talaromyces rugulosus TaxID=121627 RepID=A0A7H8QID4_TALRU|nr:uncharacterized protein TRUGW13939_00739 [Talaromyces rugulosus]QKX53660.1 hypothetical protein TRUGW13939_00739 [Talaromyces rugulosus]